MNLKERLRHIAELSMRDRATGRTTVIAKAAKEHGGIVLAHTHDDAKRIEKTYDVPARSMDMNLHGFMGPFYLDHHATERLLLRAADKIEALETANQTLRQVRENYGNHIVSLKNELEVLQKKMSDLVRSIGEDIT